MNHQDEEELLQMEISLNVPVRLYMARNHYHQLHGDLLSQMSVSNPFNGEYFARYDNFTITEGSICYLKFWGMPWMWDEFWYGCDENPMTFRIRFFEDIGLDIGNLVLSFDVELTGTPTGVFYFETGDDQYVELLEYKVNLPQKVNLKNGWVSVMGISVKSPQDCGFGWMGSPSGDAYS